MVSSVLSVPAIGLDYFTIQSWATNANELLQNFYNKLHYSHPESWRFGH